jgi:hypothetical protein
MYFIVHFITVKIFKFKLIVCHEIKKMKILRYKKAKTISEFSFVLYLLIYNEFEFGILYSNRIDNKIYL